MSWQRLWRRGSRKQQLITDVSRGGGSRDIVMMTRRISGWLPGICLAVLLAIWGTPAGGVEAELGVIKERARKLYFGLGRQKNYPQALALYLKAAQAGDPEAQYIAGGMFFKGIGTPVDYDKAFELLYMAAKNGKSTAESQKVLAQSFLLGRGVAQNFDEAKYWYSLAAEQGDREAQNELGFMYYVGTGGEQDYARAFTLFHQAAMNGFPLAQYNVGIMYYTGNGVPGPDLVSSYAWLSLAARNGHEQAKQALQFLRPALSPEQLENAQVQARRLYQTSRTSARPPK